MKKQRRKLNLSKRTISDLDANAMLAKAGGGRTNGHSCGSMCTYTCAHHGFTCRRNCGSW